MSLKGLKSLLEFAGKRISKLEDRFIEIMQTKEQRCKRNMKNEHNCREM